MLIGNEENVGVALVATHSNENQLFIIALPVGGHKGGPYIVIKTFSS